MKGPKYSIGEGKNTIVLATYCDACGGAGEVEIYEKIIECGECDGFGGMTTESGAQILALVNDILLKGRK